MVSMVYTGLQGVTMGYKGLQGITGSYKSLQGVTRGYNGLQVTLFKEVTLFKHGISFMYITFMGRKTNFLTRGGGKRRGLGLRNDVLTTCKAVTQRGGQWIITVFFP